MALWSYSMGCRVDSYAYLHYSGLHKEIDMSHRVEIDGVKYVPQEYKIPEEAIRLLAELVSATRHIPIGGKASRLQYLLTDMNGGAR